MIDRIQPARRMMADLARQSADHESFRLHLERRDVERQEGAALAATCAHVRGPLVYFVEAGVGGPIKVGWTADSLYDRITALQTGNPLRLDPVAAFRGDLWREGLVHRLLGADRIRGEWFERRPALDLFVLVREYDSSLVLFDAEAA